MSALWAKLRAAVIPKPKGLSKITHRHPKFKLMLTIRYLLRQHLPETKSRSVLDRSDYVNHVSMTVNNPSCDERESNPDAMKSRRASTTSLAFAAGRLNQELKKEETHFTVYAPTVFATLRAALGISHEDFLMSVAPGEEISAPYLQFTSNSKGKDTFFFTCDRRFVLKQEKHETIAKFMELLEEYLGHFITSPHSLIAKILGAFCVKMKNIEPVYFIVLQSIFWPSSRIEERYDLKGCLGGRFEDPRKAAVADNLVFKDQNFAGTPISLGKERGWFIEQIHRDVRFLQRLQMMDYSLLIGIQSKMADHHHCESHQTLSSFVSSVKRSSLSFGEKPSSKAFYQNDLFHWVEFLQAPHEARPESNLSLFNDVFHDELSALTETGAVRKPLLSALKSRRKGNVPKSVRQVRFNEPPNDAASPEDMESSSVQVVPALLSGIVSPVPSVHFQVHEPPSSFGKDLCEECNFNELGNALKHLKSPLKRRNKTHPSITTTEHLESTLAGGGDGEIWYTQESVMHYSSCSNTKKLKNGSMRRAKGFYSDLDRIEVASPGGQNGGPEADRRRHSFVLHQWLQAWQNVNGTENRRLLPDCDNGVHIMDGPQHRYYVGIIDIFTEYGFRQKLGRIFKSLLYCTTNHSSAPPDEYAARFVDFIEEHLT